MPTTVWVNAFTLVLRSALRSGLAPTGSFAGIDETRCAELLSGVDSPTPAEIRQIVLCLHEVLTECDPGRIRDARQEYVSQASAPTPHEGLRLMTAFQKVSCASKRSYLMDLADDLASDSAIAETQ